MKQISNRNCKNRKCIVFAGTSEGRQLYKFCTEHQIDSVFCVATKYGKEMLCKPKEAKSLRIDENPIQGDSGSREGEFATGEVSVGECRREAPNGSRRQNIRVGRMDAAEMRALFQKEKPMLIIDATHPYAAEVTENIRKAAEAYRQEQKIGEKLYYRVLRDLSGAEEMPETEEKQDAKKIPDRKKASDAKIRYFEDIGEAVAYLQSTEGNIFSTIGSKQAEELCKLQDFQKRVYLRILPNVEMLSKCLELGFLPEHMICMQGPFSEEFNALMLREHDIKYLLTKQSGKTGGYPEKAEAARICGAELVVLLPPGETEGVSVEQMCEMIRNAKSGHSS